MTVKKIWSCETVLAGDITLPNGDKRGALRERAAEQSARLAVRRRSAAHNYCQKKLLTATGGARRLAQQESVGCLTIKEVHLPYTLVTNAVHRCV